MEEKENDMIFGKGGSGSLNTKISIPITWSRKLGFSPENRSAKLILENDKIIIKKK